jgi:hypothetical protein
VVGDQDEVAPAGHELRHHSALVVVNLAHHHDKKEPIVPKVVGK